MRKRAMRNVILAFTILLAAFCAAGSRAYAGCAASMPYTFTNSVSTVDATTTNANNSFLLACALNVDHSQIGSAGIYATQIIPTTLAQALFGGSYLYTFPAGVAAGGPVTGTTGTFSGAVSGTTGTFTGALAGVGVTAGAGTVKGASDGVTSTYLAPVYTSTGTIVASTVHMVLGSGTTASLTCNNATACVFATITLSGAASYSSTTSYTCDWSLTGSASGYGTTSVGNISATSFQLVFGAQTTLGPGTFPYTYSCVGT